MKQPSTLQCVACSAIALGFVVASIGAVGDCCNNAYSTCTGTCGAGGNLTSCEAGNTAAPGRLSTLSRERICVQYTSSSPSDYTHFECGKTKPGYKEVPRCPVGFNDPPLCCFVKETATCTITGQGDYIDVCTGTACP